MLDKQQEQQFESVQSDKFISVYSNSANLEVTPWDLNLSQHIIRGKSGKPPRD